MLNRFSTHALRAVVLASFAVLAGCGGGGGGSGTDSTAPAVAITAPANLSFTNATSATVTGTASDAGGVTGVSVNGVAATSTSGAFATWTATVPLTVGANTITATASDAAANTRTASVSVTRDGTAPVAAITSPAGGTTTGAASITVTGTAADASSISGVTVNGVAATSTSGAFATWSATVPLTAGANTLTAQATDSAGNTVSVAVGVTRDATGPTAAILFPPAPGATSGTDLTVTGAAADAAGVQAVSVNGVAATSSDGFAHWRATVVLASGANTLTVSATDTFGNVTASAATRAIAKRVQPYEFAGAMAVDAANSRVLLVDSGSNAVFAFARSSGTRSLISGVERGSGAYFQHPLSLAHDAANGRVFVGDNNRFRVESVDLTTGDRTVFSSSSVGFGPAPGLCSALALDAGYSRLLIANGAAVIGADLATGNRVTVSSSTAAVGAGAAFVSTIRAIVIDPDAGRDRALVVENSASLRTMDLSSGDRGTLATFASSARDVAIDAGRDRALVLLADASIVSVSLSTGTVTAVTVTGGVGDVTPGASSRIAYDSATDTMFITDTLDAQVVAAPLTAANTIGVRSVRSSSTDYDAGIGARLYSPYGLALDSANDRVLTAERTNDTLVAIDLDDGTRTVLSGGAVGSGTAFNTPGPIVLDAANARVLVADHGADIVFAVALADGARTALSSIATGGFNHSSLDGIAHDAGRNQAILVDNALERVITVDLADGSQAVLSESGDLKGPDFSQPAVIVRDAQNDRLVVGDWTAHDLFLINPVTGTRTSVAITVASGGSGTPGAFTLDAATGTYATVIDGVSSEIITVDLVGVSSTPFSGMSKGDGPLPGSLSGGGIVYDADRDLYWAVDGALHALFAIEPVSGDRVIISR